MGLPSTLNWNVYGMVFPWFTWTCVLQLCLYSFGIFLGDATYSWNYELPTRLPVYVPYLHVLNRNVRTDGTSQARPPIHRQLMGLHKVSRLLNQGLGEWGPVTFGSAGSTNRMISAVRLPAFEGEYGDIGVGDAPRIRNGDLEWVWALGKAPDPWSWDGLIVFCEMMPSQPGHCAFFGKILRCGSEGAEAKHKRPLRPSRTVR